MGQPFIAVPSYAIVAPVSDASRAADDVLATERVTATTVRPSGVADGDPWSNAASSTAYPPHTLGSRAAAAPADGSQNESIPVASAPMASTAAAKSGVVFPTGDGERHNVSVLGPLAGYAAKPGTTDLFVNGEAGLWTDAGHGLAQVSDWHLGEVEVRALAVRLIALGGRHIDEASPCVDVRLADGIRVHAVLPPVSSTGTLLSIRLPHAAGHSLGALAETGLFGEGKVSAARLLRLRAAVHGRQNLLITGAAGSGKTTLLAALLSEAPSDERIVVIEDVAELRIRHPHVVALESRQANLEGAGRIGLEALVREALRMRPDRLVLGECRGSEIRELLAALNTGHDGGAGTLHANSLDDVPARLEALGALAGMSVTAVARQTVSAIGLVLHLERTDGARRLDAVGRFILNDRDQLSIEAL